jgi:dolichyl-phosphate-mannose-protein mannosyltransferase
MTIVTTQEAGAATVPAPPDDEPPAEGTTDLVDRMHPPLPVGPWTWLGPLLVTLFGGVLRFWHLGRPRAVVFDETYYVKDSYSLLLYGHERAYVDKADELMLAGQTDLFHERATFIVHPPVGKWIIAAGEKVAGLDPFGWRLGVAIVGTLLIFLTCRVAMRLTRSVLLGCVAGLLLAVDGLAVVMSRTALLDGILAFFLLAAFACLLVDRDDVRLKLAVYGSGRGPLGPRLGWRPWRLAAGVCLGLAVGTKWSALFYIAAFGLLTVLWDSSARRMVGVRTPRWAALRLDAVPAFGALVILPAVVYVASWSGWLSSGRGWSRHWAEAHPGGLPFVPDALRSLWHYHTEIWHFHATLTQDHPYESSPWGWLVLARPVAYYSEESSKDCAAPSCIAEVLGIGTPALWWAGLAALAYMLWRWIGARDWRAGAVLCGVAAGYLPWFLYTDRPIFFFYGIAFLPFLVLAVTLTLGAIIGPVPAPGGSVRRRAVGAVAAGTVVALVVMNFFYLYPLLTADSIPRPDWLARMWFRSWI